MSDDSIELNASDGTEFTVSTESLECSEYSDGTEYSAVTELADLMDDTERIEELNSPNETKNSSRNLRKNVNTERANLNGGVETERACYSDGSSSTCSASSLQLLDDAEFDGVFESKFQSLLKINVLFAI